VAARMDRMEVLSARSRGYASVRVFERDPALGHALATADFERAADRCCARVLRADPGVLRGWPLAREPEPGFQGFLVLQGFLSRRVVMGDRHAAELLGPGDVVRPWKHGGEPFWAASARWRAHEEIECAILDRRFHERAAAWPELSATLLERTILRSNRLVTQLLVAQTSGMSERIRMLLWHLADRWGRSSCDGVVLPLRLSKAVIAELAGTTRESASRALTKLALDGEVEPTGRGLVLRGARAPKASRAVTVEERRLTLV
jgi:CRP/FNR family transcriptional regulator, cyclic AMP receptor protein